MFIYKLNEIYNLINNSKEDDDLGFISEIFLRFSDDIKDTIKALEDPKSNGPAFNDNTTIEKGINSKGEKKIYIFNGYFNEKIETIDDDIYGDPEFFDILDELEKKGEGVGKFDQNELIKVLKKWLELQDLNFEFAILYQDKIGEIYLDGVVSQSELEVAIEKVEKIEKTSER